MLQLGPVLANYPSMLTARILVAQTGEEVDLPSTNTRPPAPNNIAFVVLIFVVFVAVVFYLQQPKLDTHAAYSFLFSQIRHNQSTDTPPLPYLLHHCMACLEVLCFVS